MIRSPRPIPGKQFGPRDRTGGQLHSAFYPSADFYRLGYSRFYRLGLCFMRSNNKAGRFAWSEEQGKIALTAFPRRIDLMGHF